MIGPRISPGTRRAAIRPRSAPLDTLAAALVVAYGMRRLVSAWSGPLVTVRRSSDNAVMDVAAGTDGWIDTATLLAWCGTASVYLTRWWDQTGRGWHAEQATAAAQPFLVIAGVLVMLGGRPALSSAAGQSMTAPLVGTVALPMSVVATVSLDTSANAIVRRLASSAVASTTEWFFDTSGAVRTTHGSSINSGSILPANTATVVSSLDDTTACAIRVNGQEKNSAYAGTLGISSGLVLFSYPGLDRPLIGRCGEFALLSRKISAATALTIETAFGASRGVTIG